MQWSQMCFWNHKMKLLNTFLIQYCYTGENHYLLLSIPSGLPHFILRLFSLKSTFCLQILPYSLPSILSSIIFPRLTFRMLPCLSHPLLPFSQKLPTTFRREHTFFELQGTFQPHWSLFFLLYTRLPKTQNNYFLTVMILHICLLPMLFPRPGMFPTPFFMGIKSPHPWLPELWEAASEPRSELVSTL